MRKIFLKEDDDAVLCALYEEKEFTRFYRLRKDMLTGSIVVGRVKFVKKGMGVFVDVGLKQDGLLSYRPGLKSGDDVLVRIETEPREDRGCSLSERITLAGKYVVLTDREEYRFSHKISEEKKIELFRLPRRENVGFVFRSLAEEADLNAIGEEMESLYKEYVSLKKTALTTRAPAFLLRTDPITIAKNSANEFAFGFGEIEKDIAGLNERKIEKEGVELVFDKTEALIAVDVNYHRFAGTGERAVFEANAVAVKEFARQLRLRNLSGLIVLDYICMPRAEQREELFSLLKEELKKDYLSCSVEQAEKSGLFIVVRQERYSY